MKETVQFKLNIPADLKHWLEEQARANIRSQGAEIIAILRAEKDRNKRSETDEIAGKSKTRSQVYHGFAKTEGELS